MFYFTEAKAGFEDYLSGYDRSNDKVMLKITHTYGVVEQSAEIAGRIGLSEEDTELAKLIALLHDIGRFEQLKRFNSFQPDTMDHAAYGAEILFENGMIRKFLPESRFDPIIREAILKHSDYRLSGISDGRTLLHAKLIRDADKLDNCRVKLEDGLETILDASEEEIGSQPITPCVFDTVFRNQCIRSGDRVTKTDYWVSFVAYFFDINFRESLDIIEENNYVTAIIDRISYSNPDTKKKMDEIKAYLNNYVHCHMRSRT